MSAITSISWCDSTINFWEGCTKVSSGCANCYAEARDRRGMQTTSGPRRKGQPIELHWGKGSPRRKVKGAVETALRLNKRPWVCDECGFAVLHQAWLHLDPPRALCQKCGEVTTRHRRCVFSLSLGDWLDPEVPIEWLAEMLDTIRRCDQLQWILCTKRPELFTQRWQECWTYAHQHRKEMVVWLGDWVAAGALNQKSALPQNIWLLTSVENQEQADKRIPELLKIPAVVHGLSCEPLLGPINLNLVSEWRASLQKPVTKTGNDACCPALLADASVVGFAPIKTPRPSFGAAEHEADRKGASLNESATQSSAKAVKHPVGCTNTLDWVIVGGESGPRGRPCHVEWIRDIKDQCVEANVPCFVKQLGSFCVTDEATPDGWPPGTELETNPGCTENALVKLHDPKGSNPSEWPEDIRVREFPKA